MESFDLRKAAHEYSLALVGYEAAVKLPHGFFLRRQMDHLAIKAQDTAEFDELANTVIDQSEEAYCIEDQGRFLVAVKLARRILVGIHGEVQWVEVKEPRSRGVSYGPVGLEHSEFYTDDLDKALHQVIARGLDHRVQFEGEHRRVDITFTEQGHQVRLSDTPIADIVTEKIEVNEAYIVKLAA